MRSPFCTNGYRHRGSCNNKAKPVDEEEEVTIPQAEDKDEENAAAAAPAPAAPAPAPAPGIDLQSDYDWFVNIISKLEERPVRLPYDQLDDEAKRMQNGVINWLDNWKFRWMSNQISSDIINKINILMLSSAANAWWMNYLLEGVGPSDTERTERARLARTRFPFGPAGWAVSPPELRRRV